MYLALGGAFCSAVSAGYRGEMPGAALACSVAFLVLSSPKARSHFQLASVGLASGLHFLHSGFYLTSASAHKSLPQKGTPTALARAPVLCRGRGRGAEALALPGCWERWSRFCFGLCEHWQAVIRCLRADTLPAAFPAAPSLPALSHASHCQCRPWRPALSRVRVCTASPRRWSSRAWWRRGSSLDNASFVRVQNQGGFQQEILPLDSYC